MIQDSGSEMQEEIKKRIIHIQINLNDNDYKIISHKGHKRQKKMKVHDSSSVKVRGG